MQRQAVCRQWRSGYRCKLEWPQAAATKLTVTHTQLPRLSTGVLIVEITDSSNTFPSVMAQFIHICCHSKGIHIFKPGCLISAGLFAAQPTPSATATTMAHIASPLPRATHPNPFTHPVGTLPGSPPAPASPAGNVSPTVRPTSTTPIMRQQRLPLWTSLARATTQS